MIDEKDLRRKKWNAKKNKRQGAQKPIKPVKKKDRIRIDPNRYEPEEEDND